MYELLHEEDNIKFMIMIEDVKNKTDTKKNVKSTKKATKIVNKDKVTVKYPNSKKHDQVENETIIKTETRTGYVNIDGTERDKSNQSLNDILKEHLNNYTSYVDAIKNTMETLNVEQEEKSTKKPKTEHVEVDDIIIAQKREPSEQLQPPSSAKAKQVFNMLPKVLKEFLSSDWNSKPKCEPQYILERIRRENRYPNHADVNRYELLLTPAPSFLQRISLAGEFLYKKQLVN